MQNDFIHIHKAKVHNLKNISISIPKNCITVITGPSGSGKSSLAFDTIYVEGQKRYIESLSSNSKQFLGEFQSPDVESITGLSPAIAIDQKSTYKNPRSTVGTTTEIYDFFRVLFAKIGVVKCEQGGQEITKNSPKQIVDKIVNLPNNTKINFIIKIEATRDSIKKYSSAGYLRCFYQEQIIFLEELPKKIKVSEELYLIIDRIIVKNDNKKRITDSVDHALYEGKGHFYLFYNDTKHLFTTKLMSPVTHKELPKVEARLFSFNSPIGSCPKCRGLGIERIFTVELLIDYETKNFINSIPIIKNRPHLKSMVETILRHENIKLDTPINQIPPQIITDIFYGSNKKYKFVLTTTSSELSFEKKYIGLIPWLENKYKTSHSEKERRDLEKLMFQNSCSRCHGKRLNLTALNIFINQKNIHDYVSCSISSCLSLVNQIKLTGTEKLIANKVLDEITTRLTYLINIGLEYLSIDRSVTSLSGGEMQRIRLATQIGNSLSGVLYVLDEPSIGLHPYDNSKLLKTMKSLKSKDNTLIIVEHDEEIILSADFLIDIGPKAGTQGGEIIASGTVNEVKKNQNSLTAQYLSGKKKIQKSFYSVESKIFINLQGATHHNLNNVNVAIPLDGLTCITGVSGSGKSTLIHEILVPAIKFHLKPHYTQYQRENFKSITGLDSIKSIIEIDQSSIGKSSKSNPATYTGLFDEIRKIYSKLPESQVRGYSAGRFSFNVKDGRCPECEGHGVKKIEINFLPNIFMTCELCQGSRYNQDTLDIKFKGHSISDILNLTVNQAFEIFKYRYRLARILSTMQSVGLGYLTLGQSALSLSGGEAQRLKLSKELSKTTKGKCLYILDEPTTGLHFDDISTLLKTLYLLLSKGNPIIVIEHNLDIISQANHIIDMGPAGGENGGEVVASGTPLEIAKSVKSKTGQYLLKKI